MAKYKRKRKTSRKYRRKSPAKRKRSASKRRKYGRKRAAKRIQRAFRRYKKRRRVKASKFKKKMNVVAKRVNTYLEPRVIRHGWTPLIGGGMGTDPALGPFYNMPGDNPSNVNNAQPPVAQPGILNWMVDISTNTDLTQCALLQPPKRHNPLLFMQVSTMNDKNNHPNTAVNPNPTNAPAGVLAYPTCQPRRGQLGQSFPIPALYSPGGFIGGAFIGGYDEFYKQYYRPVDMLSTARLYQDTEDCIAYKQFPFIPRVESNFDDTKYNGTMNSGGQIPAEGVAMMTEGVQANRFQRLEPWECRNGDKLLVRNNYHKFDIEVFPDLPIEIPVTEIDQHMPGLPECYANGGILTSDIEVNTSGTGSSGTNVNTKWPGYLTKKPKWFAKVRFLVVKRKRKYDPLWGDVGLQFISSRNNQATTGTASNRPGTFDHLYTFDNYYQKHCLKVIPSATSIMNYGEYLNVPPPPSWIQAAPITYAYQPSYNFHKQVHAREVWKATHTRADSQYKAKISGTNIQGLPNIDYLMSNAKDESLKIMYDKTVTLSGKKTSMTHIMNTMKGKVLEYLKETNPQTKTKVVQDAYEQHRTQYPLNEEYRFWVVVHAHNCRVQLRADHVFKFDA